MKIISRLFCLLLIVIAAACGSPGAATVEPGDITMTLRVEPEQLAVGEASLILTLKDSAGRPVDGAVVQIHADMDHEGMAAIDRETSNGSDGEYRLPVEWTMGGGWIVEVRAELPNNGGEIVETFDFFVEAVSSESVINRQPTPQITAEATVESP